MHINYGKFEKCRRKRNPPQISLARDENKAHFNVCILY
jgi:hypothetical protein